MTPVRARLVPYVHRLTPPVVTAGGAHHERRGIWLELFDGDKRCGLGEAAPWPGMGASLAAVRADLERLIAPGSPLWGTALTHIADVDDLVGELDVCAEAAHAADVALLDLLAQARGLALASLFGARRREVLVHALVDDGASAAAAVAQGARHLKVKVGALPLVEDDRRLRAIRDAAGPNVDLHVDANGAFDLASATLALARWRDVGLALVEQPLPASALGDLRELRRRTGVRVAVDESVRTTAELARVVDAGAADVVVVKPMLAGGFLAARRLATVAGAAGLGVIVTSVLETAAGRAAALHLGAALSREPLACGLSGRMGEDGIRLVSGGRPLLPHPGERGLVLHVPDGAGLGVVRAPERAVAQAGAGEGA